MLTKLRLQNFRCFRDHVVPFRQSTIVVGRNNAGKSTVVEALRLVSAVTNRYEYLRFSDPPRSLDLPKAERGVSPSIDDFEFDHESLFHRYSEPPAVITAWFESGSSIEAYIGRARHGTFVHAIFNDKHGRPAQTRADANKLGFHRIGILPQIGPLSVQEQVLTPAYARRAISAGSRSAHFRNEINLLHEEHFDDFRDIAETTWHGLQIKELEGAGRVPETPLALQVRNDDFVAEVGWMGDGLQMWLQTMWFLARHKGDPTIILDEPDVYMHADLQRKLIRLLRGRFPQVIVATHSLEIMAEVTPEEILVIDRDRRKAEFTDSLPAVQRVITHIGGVQNLQLTRLWNSQKCLLVEGKDIQVLKVLQDTLFPASPIPFDTMPHMSIGGWGGWNYAIGSSMILRNAVGDEIKTYCLLDSDYHSTKERNDRMRTATVKCVQLHIWAKKEIENYLLVPSAIARVIALSTRSEQTPPAPDQVAAEIDRIAEVEKEAILVSIAELLLAEDRQGGLKNAMAKARTRVEEAWGSQSGRWSVLPGKAVLSRLADWAHSAFGATLNDMKIARELRVSEIDDEMKQVVAAIEQELDFTNSDPAPTV